MTGEFTQGCSAHLPLAVQGCASVRQCAAKRGRVWASGGYGAICIQPHSKIRKMSLLTTQLSTAIPTRYDLWRTITQAFKVVKLPTPQPSKINATTVV